MLTCELLDDLKPEITNVLLRFDHVARFTVDAIPIQQALAKAMDIEFISQLLCALHWGDAGLFVGITNKATPRRPSVCQGSPPPFFPCNC